MKIAIGADHAGFELKRRVEKMAAIERERQTAEVKPTET
jgi:ribose 5-phosphate isomerase RpiB